MKVNLTKYQKSLYYEIFINKEYSLLDQIIKDSTIIFDLGSNIGLFSLYSLSLKYDFKSEVVGNELNIYEPNIKLKNDFTVHLFEPNFETYNISKNILNYFYLNIIFNNFGILGNAGKNDLIISLIDCQSSIYDSFLTIKKKTTLKVKFEKLDTYILQNNISKIDLLKIDVEGSEFDILLNLDEKVFSKIKILFLEYHILNEDFKKKFELLLETLKLNYKNIKIIEGKYNKNIGYLFCK